MEKGAKIYIAGNTGLVGSAIIRKLKIEGYKNQVYTPYPEYDLRNQQQVNDFFKKEKPEYVFLAAAKVGGIIANSTYKAEFLYDNTMIEFNVIHAAYKHNVKKLLFLGSSCIYPKNCPQPIKEDYLLTGSLETTNEPYALAKISGLKMCDYYRKQYGCDFISAMPTNLYGSNDNFNLETSHVLPALIRKMHLAKLLENSNFKGIHNDLSKRAFSIRTKYDSSWNDEEIIEILKINGIRLINNSTLNINKLNKVSLTFWGSGSPYREFLNSDDLADALLYLMNDYSDYGHINVGTGKDLTIKELTLIIKDVVGFKGKLDWDLSKPDGTPKKLLDVSKLNAAGWNYKTELIEGINTMYINYKQDF